MGGPDQVTALAIGPDGWMYAGSRDTIVLAWDPQSLKPPAGRE
jgi:hypothetical protein